jgi:two-component system phosphate regulon sensor histidine kinase PhoR
MPAVVREIERDVEAPVDAGLLRLAVDNLLDNAHKYAPLAAPYRVIVRDEASRLVVEVSDRGPGIAQRDQRRIFAPFERLDDKLSRETEGSGLGLSLVAAVLLAHGGEVRVESELGQGAKFVLVFMKPKHKDWVSRRESREEA